MKDDAAALVLIGLGLAVYLLRPNQRFASWVNGQGDVVITFALISVMIVYALIALFAKPGLKALALVWAVTP